MHGKSENGILYFKWLSHVMSYLNFVRFMKCRFMMPSQLEHSGVMLYFFDGDDFAAGG